MKTLRWILITVAVIQGAWMVFDGTRALIVGDYVTPREGPYAGELGPWAKIVRKAGIEPRSFAMKMAFVAFGVAWLTVAGLVLFRAPAGRTLAMVLAVATLWYAPVGTALSMIALASVLALFARGS